MRATWVLGGMLVAGSAFAADWPQWYGPARDGRSAETGIVEGWLKGPKELWRTAIGPGYASVAVAEGVVYAMTSKDAEEQVAAFDAVTGAERWRSRVGPFYEDGMGYDGPRATPTVAGDRIIAMGGYGGVVAVNRATGERLWAVDTVKTLGGVMPQWGFSGSPLVSGDKVYVATGGQAENGLVALKLSDGTAAWKSGSFGAGYSSPVRGTVAGKDQLVFFTGLGAVGADPETGKVHFTYPWKTNYEVNAATPLLVGSRRIFVASAYGVGGAMLEVADDGKVSELWRTRKMKNKTSTSVLHEGHLYGFNESTLTCLDAATGEERWAAEGYGRGSVILAEGHLVVVSEQCAISLVKATPKGHEPVGKSLQTLTTAPCWTAPALAAGVLYARDGKDLVAIEIKPFGPTL